jgi:hypothetical protein
MSAAEMAAQVTTSTHAVAPPLVTAPIRNRTVQSIAATSGRIAGLVIDVPTEVTPLIA